MNEFNLFDNNRLTGEYLSIEVGKKGIEFVWCSPGKFRLGYPDGPSPYARKTESYPEITLTKGFWIATKPITRKLVDYISLMEVAPIGRRFEKTGLSPVSHLTWFEADRICRRISEVAFLSDKVVATGRQSKVELTLPTQAQWEYACKAGTETKWFFGNSEEDLSRYAWYDDSTEKLPAVGQKEPNPWGIYDMYGMVYEWCRDQSLGYHLWSDLTDPIITDKHPKVRAAKEYMISKNHVHTDSMVIRGGCITSRADACTSTSQRGLLTNNPDDEATGIRPVIVWSNNCQF